MRVELENVWRMKVYFDILSGENNIIYFKKILYILKKYYVF